MSVATGHPVKRRLLQPNNLPKSIPELSLQNWETFLAPQTENIQKGLTCYQDPNLKILKTLLKISKKYFDLFNSADDKLLLTKVSIIVPVQKEEKEETHHTILFISSVPLHQIEKEKIVI